MMCLRRSGRIVLPVAAILFAALPFVLQAPSRATGAEGSPEAKGAAAPVSIEGLWSPLEILAFRKGFLKDFRRIGLNTTPGEAAFLRVLVESSKAQRGVEIGTATGYGAVAMGMGFEHTGGHLTTIDIDPKMVQTARENIAKAGLSKTVTAVEGDALKAIPQLEGKFDFVFIDAVKRDYFKYFKALQPMLKPGAVIVADNVIRSAGEMRDFLDAMEKDPDFDLQIIRCSDEKGDGMAVICKLK